MQVALWADPKAGDEVIDVCAAPGGKGHPYGGDAVAGPGMWKHGI